MYRGSAWIYETTSGIFLVEKSRRPHCRQRIYFDDPLQIRFISLFRCRKQWKFQMQKQQWTRNGRSYRQLQLGSWESQMQEGGSPGSTKRQTNVHFATLMDDCHLKKCGVRTKISEVQGSSRAPKRHCKRWFWFLCSIFWTWFISFAPDCCKSNGWHCKTTRLWRTSSRREICLHAG